MTFRAACVGLALIVLLAGAVACTDGGGGVRSGPLTLAEYFDELEGSSTDLDERAASLVETLEASDDVEELKEAAGQYPDVLGDFLEDLEALEPPGEAAAAHEDALDAGREFLDLLAGAVDDAEQAETEAELLEVFGNDELVSATTAFSETCVALQTIADDNGIDVDLGCELL